MQNIHPIADYVILRLSSDEGNGVVNLKLQKLMYYIQAWYLAFNKEKLFDADFQAWVHGPVNRELYDRFKVSKGLYTFITPSDVQESFELNSIQIDNRNHIDSVLEAYEKYSATELEIMTHNEDPWIITRQGYSSFQRCEKVISSELMAEYYSKRLS